jgi:hypothetical protein
MFERHNSKVIFVNVEPNIQKQLKISEKDIDKALDHGYNFAAVFIAYRGLRKLSSSLQNTREVL